MRYTNKEYVYTADGKRLVCISPFSYHTSYVLKYSMAVSGTRLTKYMELIDREGEAVWPWVRRKSYDKQTKFRKSRRAGLAAKHRRVWRGMG